MKVVSWNIHRCFGTDRQYRPDRIVEALRMIDADLIALQEIDSSLRAENGQDQLSYFASELNMNPMMGPTLSRDYGAYGNAILSRYDYLAKEKFDLSYRKVEPRGAIAVVISTPAGRIRVVNTHLGLKYWERSFQIDKLLGQIVWREEPLSLLIGDFNEWLPFTGNNLRLERAFGSIAPRLKTFPSPWPRFSLDRIFLSGSVSGMSYDVPRNPVTRVASDHLPIVMQFSPKHNEVLT